MTKNERHETILAIIAAEEIRTQEQLLARLRERGVTCTQATISRDIRQLRLSKGSTGGGRSHYAAAPQGQALNFEGRLQMILHESTLSVDCAQNLVVIKTMPGLAGAAGAAFDGMDIAQKVGTLAGDDTVLIVMRDAESAAALCAELDKTRKDTRK